MVYVLRVLHMLQIPTAVRKHAVPTATKVVDSSPVSPDFVVSKRLWSSTVVLAVKQMQKILNNRMQNSRFILLSIVCWYTDINSYRNTGNTKQNNKSKCSNDPYSTYLQDFFAVISLTSSTITNIWVASCNISTEWRNKFQLSRSPVILTEHQGHSNKNQTVEFSSV